MKTSLLQYIQFQLSECLGRAVFIQSHQQVSGGDINTTFIVRSDKERWFVKMNGKERSKMFEKEEAGLKWLQHKSSLKVPVPLLQGIFENDCFLIMEYIERETHTKKSWQKLGEGIAALHRNTNPQFGWYDDNYIGNLPQWNRLSDTWSEFYAVQRIQPLLQQAFDKNLCTATDLKEGEKLCNRFYELFPAEPSALLHGDLWNGNIMACAGGNAAIYDPAIYYGNREMDIAMTLLFGGFDEAFYHHYNEAYPLENDWQKRVGLCQLYPLLVHLVLFGSGYYGRVKNILKSYA